MLKEYCDVFYTWRLKTASTCDLICFKKQIKKSQHKLLLFLDYSTPFLNWIIKKNVKKKKKEQKVGGCIAPFNYGFIS